MTVSDKENKQKKVVKSEQKRNYDKMRKMLDPKGTLNRATPLKSTLSSESVTLEKSKHKIKTLKELAAECKSMVKPITLLPPPTLKSGDIRIGNCVTGVRGTPPPGLQLPNDVGCPYTPRTIQKLLNSNGAKTPETPVHFQGVVYKIFNITTVKKANKYMTQNSRYIKELIVRTPFAEAGVEAKVEVSERNYTDHSEPIYRS